MARNFSGDDDCHVWQVVAHLGFWRNVEAKKSRVSVVVAALLVLVDLLLKYSQLWKCIFSGRHTKIIGERQCIGRTLESI